jgi:hypothetical protein
MTYVHTTLAEHVDSIREEGLIPSHPVYGERANYADLYDEPDMAQQPEAVYAFPAPEDYPWASWNRTHRVVFKWDGRRVKKDPIIPRAVAIPHRIPPENIIAIEEL